MNANYFMRWLSDFEADGPLPLESTFDHVAEISESYFVEAKKWMLYGRGSWVRGEFGDSYECGAGSRQSLLSDDIAASGGDGASGTGRPAPLWLYRKD